MAIARDLRISEAAATVLSATVNRLGGIDAPACISGAVWQQDLFQLTGSVAPALLLAGVSGADLAEDLMEHSPDA